jgi:hypothetical protein
MKYIISSRRHDGDEGAYLEANKRYRIVLDDGSGCIIENPTGHFSRYNRDKRMALIRSGLATENMGLWYLYKDNSITVINGNEFGCKHNCIECKGKCELWESI